jgi:Fungal specific transcription factor domain
VFDLLEAQSDATTKAHHEIRRCKDLGHLIKSQRVPSWPLSPRPDLPTREVADELVDCYLRTIENVYRILHVPTFWKDYNSLWTSSKEQNTAFTVQLKLVLAIGAITYDEQFSLRASAIRWVYEAQTWLSKPEFKSRLSIQFLQTNLLLLIAREYINVGGDLVWVSVGTLLRTAIYMGLHRDPASLPIRTPFIAEMRRRVWNSILEFSLESCMTSGGPPLISIGDFDTEAPGNLDDEQMGTDELIPKPEAVFTQTSVAIALHKTFPIRLAIAKHLNDLGSPGAYEDALRLDAELRKSYKRICQTLRGYNSTSAHSPSDFAMRVVDLLLQRYFSALHIPFFSNSLQNTTFAFSRTVVIESSLKIWCTAYRSSSLVAMPTSGDASPSQHDMARLTICGFGLFRITAMLASLFIAIELKAQLERKECLGPVLLRSDLLCVLEEARVRSLLVIKAGETNIKGYVLVCMAHAQIEGLRHGLPKEKLPEVMIKATEEAEEACLKILEEQAGQIQAEDIPDNFDYTPEIIEDWDFLVRYILLGSLPIAHSAY